MFQEDIFMLILKTHHFSFFKAICLTICGIIFYINAAWAEHNNSRGIAIDMDIFTHQYTSYISTIDIESQIVPQVYQEILIAIVVQNMTNLDTYEIEIAYNPDCLIFKNGYEDSPMQGINNILKQNNGHTIGFQAVEISKGRINIANSLAGIDVNEAPEGSGIIGILKFQIVNNRSSHHISISNVHLLDTNQKEILIQTIEPGLVKPASEIIVGDLDHNQKLDLIDAVLGLKLCVESDIGFVDESQHSSSKSGQFNNLANVIRILQILSNMNL